MANIFQLRKTKTENRYGNVVVFVLFGMLVGGSFMQYYLTVTAPRPQLIQTAHLTSEKVVAKPTSLRIPAIDLETSFEGPLGINADQTVAVPESYAKVGWYQYAPLPGELGPAVILGHVDSHLGPAVFYGLQFTKPGDIVEIEREDGSIGRFAITKHVVHEQSDFPTELVYGDIDHAGLRLITCSGTYDRGQQVYSHNLIVFAELVEDVVPTQTAENNAS